MHFQKYCISFIGSLLRQMHTKIYILSNLHAIYIWYTVSSKPVFIFSMYMSSIGMTSLTQENWNCVSLNVLGPIKEPLFLILRPWWSELLQPAKASTQHQRWDYKEFLKLCLSYLMTGTSIWCTQKTWWMAQHFYSARPPEDVTLLASWGTNAHCCVGYVGLR